MQIALNKQPVNQPPPAPQKNIYCLCVGSNPSAGIVAPIDGTTRDGNRHQEPKKANKAKENKAK